MWEDLSNKAIQEKQMFIVVTMLIFFMVLCITIVFFNREYDPEFEKQWYLHNDEMIVDIDAKKMWHLLSKNSTGKEVVVAVIDTGVDYRHKEFLNNMWTNKNEIAANGIDDDNNGYIDDIYGWSAVEKKPFKVEQIESNHGTICAGIISAQHNGKGIEGICRYGNVKIMPIKVLSSKGSNGEGTIENIIEGISYAERNGARICNISFSTECNHKALYRIIKESKMLFIAPAGNNNCVLRTNIDKKKCYPGSYILDNLITVTNISKEGFIEKNSNYGPKSVDVAAPGKDIYSIIDRNTYGYVSGTSFSTAVVTGIAANLYLIDDSISSIEVKKLICDTVTKSEKLNAKCISGGYVNGGKAVEKCMKGGL